MTTDELARRRLELQVRKLMRLLEERQYAVYCTDQIEDVVEWRKAARIAGRRLGRGC